MLDLRLPVGVFFLIVGAILGIYGVTTPHPVEGYAVDKDWGACLFVFGVLMAVFGWRGQKADDEYDQERDAREAKTTAPK